MTYFESLESQYTVKGGARSLSSPRFHVEGRLTSCSTTSGLLMICLV